MTTEPPTTPHGWEQINTNGGTGYQGGEHHHYYSGTTIGQPATAAAAAAAARVVVGSPVSGWDPLELGVHTSITATVPGGQAGLPRYVTRPHDQQLRAILRDHVDRGESGLVLLVGDSCTGKTRALYEAVTDPAVGLTSRPIYKPARPGQRVLADQLRAGLPGPVIVWLDELQRYVGQHDLGASVTSALHTLLTTEPSHVGGPILVLATLWTTTLTALTTEPRTDAGGAAGADTIRTLLTADHNHHVNRVTVAPDFTDADPTQLRAAAAADPRIRAALDAAGDPARITQILAGGTNLLARLYPHDPDLKAAALDAGPPFHSPARAIIYAAGELRRVGWVDRSIPQALLRGVATGYLDTPHHKGWFENGITEATCDAAADQQQTLNIHTHGIPALVAIEDAQGQPPESYDLHDYLIQDHLTRNAFSVTADSLWTTLASESASGGWAAAMQFSQSARRRGLLTHAISFLEPWISERRDVFGSYVRLHIWRGIDEREAQGLLNLTRNRSERRLVARRLADEGLHSGWRELRAMAEAGDETSVATLMRCLSRRRQQTDLEELRRWRDAGERRAGAELLRLDAARFTLAALDELRRLRDDGDRAAGERLYYLLAKRGTEDDLTELKACASDGDASAQKRLDEARAGQGDDQALTRLKAQAASGGAPSQRRVARALSRRGDDAAIELLRECADAGDGSAQHHLARWLARQGDEASLRELRTRTVRGDQSARALLIDRYVAHADIEGLKWCVHGGYRLAAKRLISLYRRDQHNVFELDVGGNPVTTRADPGHRVPPLLDSHA